MPALHSILSGFLFSLFNTCGFLYEVWWTINHIKYYWSGKALKKLALAWKASFYCRGEGNWDNNGIFKNSIVGSENKFFLCLLKCCSIKKRNSFSLYSKIGELFWLSFQEYSAVLKHLPIKHEFFSQSLCQQLLECWDMWKSRIALEKSFHYSLKTVTP